ncbi:hypothetical protein CWB97_22780, partial [Pseudoalteromonas citrea]
RLLITSEAAGAFFQDKGIPDYILYRCGLRILCEQKVIALMILHWSENYERFLLFCLYILRIGNVYIFVLFSIHSMNSSYYNFFV